MSIRTVLTLRYCNWLAFSGRPAGRPISAPRARLAAAGNPGARPAAPDPGPAGPARPRRSASRAPWARAGLFKSGGRRGLRSLLAPTSSPTRQPDTHGLRLAAPRRHCAGRSARPRGPLRCRRRGHVAAPRAAALPPAWSRGGPGVRVDTSCGHGDMGDGGGRCAPSLIRPMGHPLAQQKTVSSHIADCGSTGAAK